MKKFWSYPLVEFSSAFDADVVKIIDNEYLSRNNCLSDEDALKKILEDKHEMEKYNRAVICLDLDKISGIRLEESFFKGLKYHFFLKFCSKLFARRNGGSYKNCSY